MAKEETKVCGVGGCKGNLVTFLVVGILYLLKDLAVADWTFGIQWYTVLFVLIPLHALLCKCK
ncbi:MAG: hypothetical protein V3V78_04945 [Candidatus Woesearchaeota archaeon]